MGKAARAKAAHLTAQRSVELMLDRQDIPVIAMLVLIDTLLIDMDRTDRQGTGDREMRVWRAGVREQIKKGVERLHSSYQGRVREEFVEKCDRYLCKVQDAMDTFFDEVTPEDLAQMDRVKGNWPQHKETHNPSFEGIKSTEV